MKRALKAFFKDPEPVSDFGDVVSGLNVIDGIARIEEPLLSPVRGQNCVAYFYQGFAMVQGARMPTQHKIKQAEVYAPFDLQMDGGTIRVVPVRPGDFTREEHKELSEKYGQNLRSTEDVILPGARVRLKGKVKEVDGGKVLRMKTIAVLDKQAVAAGVVGDRKTRKAKRRKKKRK